MKKGGVGWMGVARFVLLSFMEMQNAYFAFCIIPIANNTKYALRILYYSVQKNNRPEVPKVFKALNIKMLSLFLISGRYKMFCICIFGEK
jgi:hypothetical protein